MTRALWLPDVFRDAGLPIELHPDWERRGSSNFDPQWIIEHHDVSPAGMRTMPGALADGRGGPHPVTGPLCNWYPLRNGVIRIVASGRANHAGKGVYPDGVTDDNGHSYGSEGANNGTGEPWPEVQMDAIARADAALCRYHGWGAERVIGHKEYARPKGRKIDPTYDMDAHRRRVAALISAKPATPTVTPLPPELENVMSAVFTTNHKDYGSRAVIIVDGKHADFGLTAPATGVPNIPLTPAQLVALRAQRPGAVVA